MNAIKDTKKSQELLNELSSSSPQLEKIANLLNDGADINYQSAEDGCTALMRATELGHNTISEYLLQVGANPLLQNHRHQIASDLIQPHTPLYQYLKGTELLFATHAQDIALVKKLISQGADVNIQGAGGYTPLLIAVEESNLELVELFLISGADQSLTRHDGQGVFELVIDSLIHLTLQNGEPYSEEEKNEIRADEEIDESEIYEQARIKTLAERGNRPFHINQLKMYDIKPPANEILINELEHHFGHPIPTQLKEIFRHYNGGNPQLHIFGEYDEHHSIGYFYRLDNDREYHSNVWQIIKKFGKILGPQILPFAEHSFDGIYFLKSEHGQTKVYILLYGERAWERFDDDDLQSWDKPYPPVLIEHVCDSFDEFLEGLYDA